MKRLTAFILVLIMTFACFAGCSDKDAQNDAGGSASENGNENGNNGSGNTHSFFGKELKLTEEFEKMADKALIFRSESSKYIDGGKILKTVGQKPVTAGGILYIPANILCRHFKAEPLYDKNSENLTFEYKSKKISLYDNSVSFSVGSENRKFTRGTAGTGTEMLVPAKEFCEAINEGCYIYNENTAIIEGNAERSINSLEKEDSDIILSALENSVGDESEVGSELKYHADKMTYDEHAKYANCVTFHPDEIPCKTPDDKICAGTGSLYIENLVIKPSSKQKNASDVSMTVYNYLGYTYGIAEVYDKDDNLKDIHKIYPFEGQKASFVKAATDFYYLFDGTLKSIQNQSIDYLSIKTELNSTITDISVTVPEGGYIVITTNPNLSKELSFYDGVHYIMTFISTCTDTFRQLNKKLGLDSSTSVIPQIEEGIVHQIKSNSKFANDFLACMDQFFMNKDGTAFTGNSKNYVKARCEGFRNIFEALGDTMTSLLETAIKEKAKDLADSGVRDFLNMSLPEITSALKAWDISAASSNLFCLLTDIENCVNTGSLLIDIYDWKELYAKVLYEELAKKENYSRYSFMLDSFDGDRVPDLFVVKAQAHSGNWAKIYCYNKRKINRVQAYGADRNDRPLRESDFEFVFPYGVFSYVPVVSTVDGGDMHQGMKTMTVSKMDGNYVMQKIMNFTEYQGKYTYCKKNVAKWYYDLKLKTVREGILKNVKRYDGNSKGFILTEANIKKETGH